MYDLISSLIGDLEFFILRKAVAYCHNMVIQNSCESHCEKLLPPTHISKLRSCVFKDPYNNIIIVFDERGNCFISFIFSSGIKQQ